MFSQRHVKDEDLDVQRLRALWLGDDSDEYGTGAVIGTTAITLKMMGRADTIPAAEAMAKQMWEARAKEKFGAAA
jgi:hypothetical protein